MTKDTLNAVEYAFQQADELNKKTIRTLEWLRDRYASSKLKDRKARVRALDSKIDALRAVKLDAIAFPWSEDFL